jgi:hypothetical protein
VRQFWLHYFLRENPEKILEEYNHKTGWANPSEFPRGTWFTARSVVIGINVGPTAEKAGQEAAACDEGLPDFI